MTKSMNALTLGVLFALVSAIGMAGMNASVKALGDAASLPVIIFFRFAFSFIFVLPLVMRETDWRVRKPVMYGLRIIAGLVALWLTYAALAYAPLTSVLLLNATSPLFIPILAAIFLGTKTSLSVWLGILIGFIGVVLVLDPGPEMLSNPGDLLALASGLVAAAAILVVRMLIKTDSPNKVMIYYYGVSAIVMLAFALGDWQWPQTERQWMLLFGVGAFGTLYQIMLTYAVTQVASRIVTPLAFTSVIWGALLDLMVWQVVPSGMEFLGFAVVIIGVVIVVMSGRKTITTEPHIGG